MSAVWCDCEGRRVPRADCFNCDSGCDDWECYDDPPLYAAGALAGMDEAGLQKEWGRQCKIHDHGVDNLPMGHPTIEDAAARLTWVEAEQKRRGFRVGPSDAWWGT